MTLLQYPSCILLYFHRVGVALSMPNVWSIAKKFSSQDSAIVSLSPKVQRNLVEGLMKACMEVSDERTKEELKAQVIFIKLL